MITMFIKQNSIILLCAIAGNIMGYYYWDTFGIYYGTLPLSSECWVNCIYGTLFGGLLGTLIKRC